MKMVGLEICCKKHEWNYTYKFECFHQISLFEIRENNHCGGVFEHKFRFYSLNLCSSFIGYFYSYFEQ